MASCGKGAGVTTPPRTGNVDNPEHRAVAEPNTVLLGLVGSTVHGVTVDSADDRDEMGICIEPPEYVGGTPRVQPVGLQDAAGGSALGAGRRRPYGLLASQVVPSRACRQPDGDA